MINNVSYSNYTIKAWTNSRITSLRPWKLPKRCNTTIVHASRYNYPSTIKMKEFYTHDSVNAIAYYPPFEIFHVSVKDKYAMNAHLFFNEIPTNAVSRTTHTQKTRCKYTN